MTTQKETKVQDHPAFIRLESKVDSLRQEIGNLNALLDKTFVTRTEFEVFRATITPNNKLISNALNYIVMALIGAALAIMFGDKIPL